MVINLFQFPGLPQIRCAFTGRGAGNLDGNLSFNADADSAIQSRQELFRCLGPHGLANIAECRQIHGTNIIVEPKPCIDPLTCAMSCIAADGMFTAKAGLGLMIKTADCQPLLISDGAHVMALHVGWRGNRQNFPAKGVRLFCEYYDTRPENLWTVRGPSLNPAEFVNFDQEWDQSFLSWYNDTTSSMDLWQLTTAQLTACGVPAKHIYNIDIDTKVNANAYFSWRHSRTPGRQAGLIWIKELK